MAQSTIVLIGAGGHARSCIDVIEKQGSYKIAGLVGRENEVGQQLFGYPIIGTDRDLPALAVEYKYALITVGQIINPDARIGLYEQAQRDGFLFGKVISPLAYVSPRAVTGAGTIIMHGAIINAGATVGENCIINSHSLIEHDSEIGNHCHISTGVVLNGSVRVGEGTFIGSGSKVRENLVLGQRVFIDMGTILYSSVSDHKRVTSKIK